MIIFGPSKTRNSIAYYLDNLTPCVKSHANKLNGQALFYISDLIYFNSAPKSLRSDNKTILYVPPSLLKFKGDRAFAVAAPWLRNQLPADIKCAPSISVFKSRLLYSIAFPDY